MDAERITLFAVDPKTGELVCQVSKDPFFQGVRMSYGHGIVGHVALTRRSLNIVNAYSDPRFNQLSDIKTGSATGGNTHTHMNGATKRAREWWVS